MAPNPIQISELDAFVAQANALGMHSHAERNALLASRSLAYESTADLSSFSAAYAAEVERIWRAVAARPHYSVLLEHDPNVKADQKQLANLHRFSSRDTPWQPVPCSVVNWPSFDATPCINGLTRFGSLDQSLHESLHTALLVWQLQHRKCVHFFLQVALPILRCDRQAHSILVARDVEASEGSALPDELHGGVDFAGDVDSATREKPLARGPWAGAAGALWLLPPRAARSLGASRGRAHRRHLCSRSGWWARALRFENGSATAFACGTEVLFAEVARASDGWRRSKWA